MDADSTEDVYVVSDPDLEPNLAPTTSGSHYVYENSTTARVMLAGGIAGAASKTATAPLARLTILYQVQALAPSAVGLGLLQRQPSLLEAFQMVVKQEGFRSLWKGNGVTIIHRIPYSSINFYTYETCSEFLEKRFPQSGSGATGFQDVARRLAAGAAAGLVAGTVAYPLDLVRTRLAAQTHQRHYHGITHALTTIVRKEGPVGLYRGLGATLVQIVPSLAINYATYESLKVLMSRRGVRCDECEGGSAHQPPTSVATSLACGSVAGLVSSTATFPLDLVRRRMQMDARQRGAMGHGLSYSEVVAEAVRRGGGVRGLYVGILPEYCKVIPGVAIAFCTYEMMKRLLHVDHASLAKQRG